MKNLDKLIGNARVIAILCNQFGDTGKGNGPTYADKINRRGIQVRDLFDKDELAKKLRDRNLTPDVDSVISQLMPYVPEIAPFVRDTVTEMHQFMRDGKRILLEGAQGLLLSIEHGTFPYVTSSDCSLNGTASGVGLSARMVDLPLGIVKFPFMTRVGAGPFPTELGEERSEHYCGEDSGNRLKDELKASKIPFSEDNGKISYDHSHPKIIEMMNSVDPFVRGVGIRLVADEYGATTKRPRRVGWTDAVAARYAVGINGPIMILTKPDSLSSMDEFNVCHGYENDSRVHQNFSRGERFLRGVKPVYKSYGGYSKISSIRNYDDLPGSLQEAIKDFEEFTGGKVAIVSVGAEREETIVR
ncbi:adenylosuccinate synthetase [Candidatus Pacearchaeota archaeon]|nr:adenylosuccinate synthetase [Candidatus Pacearchaeota archaeon]